ncbi:MAG: hypothetical protein JWQ09_6085 [Segetibacter sp.]|nr:hypothetical protein [Segetibacter sp.]
MMNEMLCAVYRLRSDRSTDLMFHKQECCLVHVANVKKPAPENCCLYHHVSCGDILYLPPHGVGGV